MQMVKRLIGGLLLLIIFLWLFSPKQELYYLLEKELEKKGIVISNETFHDHWLGLEITNADIYLKGIKVAEAQDLTLNVFFLYNTLTINKIQTDKGIHNIAPKSIETLTATFSIIAPYKIALTGEGSFGSIYGGLYLNLDNKLLIRFNNAKEIAAFKKFLKKDQKGLYYETYFK
ncbi:MAG TPA: hypothetical protein ENK86_02940 [Campylobacterales bacterium]|nr:hypothetical protein [Campylobacterales bacterium]